MTWWQILLIILAVILVLLVVLYFVGSKMQRKQAASQEQMDAMKQTLSMLIIDKKKMKLRMQIFRIWFCSRLQSTCAA